MLFENVSSINCPELTMFASLTDCELRNNTEVKEGIFIAESPKVILRALSVGYFPLALLCERKHIVGDAAEVIEKITQVNPAARFFTGDREVLHNLTGYKLTRGVLCAMQRKPIPNPLQLLSNCHRVAVLEEISDAVNIGAIMRSAAALSLDAVILDTKCCDPLNRRAVRVSMGNVFLIPWTIVENPVEVLHVANFKCAALALREDSISISNPLLSQETRLAMVLGNEGIGLSDATIEACDYTVKIPMKPGVDSLNVAAAAAVAFWQLNNT